jgi:hypothetical protein
MSFEEIATRLNEAIESGDFEEALRMAHEYRREFERVWAAMPTEDRRRSSLLGDAVALHHDAEERMLAKRSLLAGELRGLKAGARYRRTQRSCPDGWQASV